MTQKEKAEILAKEQADKQRVFDAIGSEDGFTDEEKRLICEINTHVMSADGTAEGWGYDCNPTDYVGESVEIFNLAKAFFTKNN